MDELYDGHINNILQISDDMKANDRLCFLGDFNLNRIVWSEVQNSEKFLPSNVNRSFEINFIDSLFSIGLQQVNKLFNNLRRLLDLVFVSLDMKFSVFQCNFPISPATLHHSAICINLQFYEYAGSQFFLQLLITITILVILIY